MMRAIFFKTTVVFCLLIFTANLYSQVCNGSLGDPVVNVTFGTGNNPGQPLLSATTTYNFITTSCPDDGNYTVVNSTSGCFSSWHTIPEDHTPNDENGYMMLVNATFTPGDFYVDTVKGLCANTTYEFAAWIVNVLGPSFCMPAILPKLVFNIETSGGVVLGTYSTGDIPGSSSPVWKQYGLFFTTPANTNNVVIRLTNTAPGGCGNDIALDDITFRPCGPSVKLSGGNNQSSFDLCAGNVTPVTISATVGPGYITPNLQWQESINGNSTWADIPGATSSTYIFGGTAVGVYNYRLAVAEGSNILLSSCRIASDALTITIHETPNIAASVNSPVCESTLIKFSASGGSTYTWTGINGFTANGATPVTIASVTSSGEYMVVGKDQFGCADSAIASVLVNLKPQATINSEVTLCAGDSTVLTAGGGGTYLWTPAAGLSSVVSSNPTAKPAATSTYMVVVTGSNACTDTAEVLVNVLSKPVVNAGPDKMLLRGESTMLDGSVTGTNADIFWTPSTYLSDASIVNPVSTPAGDQVYTLHAESGCGSSSDEVFVKVYNDIYIPKAFTPNGDGLNDTWNIEALVVFPNSRLVVYNRFGQVVFEGSAMTPSWNGLYQNKSLPVGAYAYMLDLKSGRAVIKGTVLIVR